MTMMKSDHGNEVKKMVILGLEPRTTALLALRSTDWAIRPVHDTYPLLQYQWIVYFHFNTVQQTATGYFPSYNAYKKQVHVVLDEIYTFCIFPVIIISHINSNVTYATNQSSHSFSHWTWQPSHTCDILFFVTYSGYDLFVSSKWRPTRTRVWNI